MQKHPGSLIVSIISAMPEKQTGAAHFTSTILKPVFGSLHRSPLDSANPWCNIKEVL
jgi:hypothetical protein